jgi:hypothetical protein
MGMTVRVIEEIGGNRRVIVFRRENGTYGFTEEHFSDEPLEQCWIPQRPDSESFCDSEETAVKEATGRVDWLAMQGGE